MNQICPNENLRYGMTEHQDGSFWFSTVLVPGDIAYLKNLDGTCYRINSSGSGSYVDCPIYQGDLPAGEVPACQIQNACVADALDVWNVQVNDFIQACVDPDNCDPFAPAGPDVPTTSTTFNAAVHAVEIPVALSSQGMY